MITTKEYINHLELVRNDFYNRNNIVAAEKVQEDINKLIIEELNK